MKYNCEFIFLGSNIDAVEVARDIGINEDRAAYYNYDEVGTTLNFEVFETVKKILIITIRKEEHKVKPLSKTENKLLVIYS